MDGGNNALYAPVHLAHGGEIATLYVRYDDGDASNDMTVRLVRQERDSATLETIGTFTSSGTTTGVEQENILSASLTNTTINNYSYTYRVSFKPKFLDVWSTDLKLYSVTIYVTVSD